MSVHVVRRSTASGRRYHVRYRRGGRGYKLEHAGAFGSQKEAHVRRDLVAGWLAGGKDPRAELVKLSMAQSGRRIADDADAFYRARKLDLAPSSHRTLNADIERIKAAFGKRSASEIAGADVADWVAELAEKLKPTTVRRYLGTLRLLFDFLEVDPNPARHRTIKLPRVEREEFDPPSGAHVKALLRKLRKRLVAPIIVLEQTAMRVGEAESLAWGDVDVAGCRFRLRGRETKSGRARWVAVPDWLMAELDLSCAVEDRVSDRRVFPDFDETRAWKGMDEACRLARIPHFHPHDLRHRRITIWHHGGVPARELADRAGHAQASMSLDTYSHVMPLAEVPVEVLKALLASARDAPVMARRKRTVSAM
jgi:integrase